MDAPPWHQRRYLRAGCFRCDPSYCGIGVATKAMNARRPNQLRWPGRPIALSSVGFAVVAASSAVAAAAAVEAFADR